MLSLLNSGEPVEPCSPNLGIALLAKGLPAATIPEHPKTTHKACPRVSKLYMVCGTGLAWEEEDNEEEAEGQEKDRTGHE